ncbi:uncharacterized protein TNCV_427221 [Trichonephila clavipes]|nr:uncharacterized protein TNCV_427221 [Trichonephila clavipes]
MALKATANDRHHLALCHDEFRGPRSGLCRSGGISNNKNNFIQVMDTNSWSALLLSSHSSPVGVRQKFEEWGASSGAILDNCSWFKIRGSPPAAFVQLQNKGCGSPVVRVSDHGRYVMSSSPVPLKTRRVGQRCTLNRSRAETSSSWCGVVVRRGRCELRCRPRHLTMVQNYVVRRQKPSCS